MTQACNAINILYILILLDNIMTLYNNFQYTGRCSSSLSKQCSNKSTRSRVHRMQVVLGFPQRGHDTVSHHIVCLTLDPPLYNMCIEGATLSSNTCRCLSPRLCNHVNFVGIVCLAFIATVSTLGICWRSGSNS